MKPLTRIVATLTLTLAALLSGALLPAAGTAGQGRERVVAQKADFGPPVRITGIKVGGRAVTAGRGFRRRR